MSGVWGWFGGGAAQKKKDTPKNAILGLRAQLDMLQKREKHLQAQMDEQDAIARKNVNGNKNAAKAALRRKKAHEHSYDQTISQIGTLEQQIYAIESANINRETLAAMERAGEAMKQIHGKLTPEKVDDTMDKLREQNALSEEIVQAITSNQLGGEPLDEDELDEELEALQQEQLDKKMLDSGTVPVSDAVHRMPNVANSDSMGYPALKGQPAAAEEDDEEAELKRLQAEMAM
ncbi:vacuolar-sorting protein SNF7 [Xylariomycetidae sp. FL0641]|nr:vacuolar-sorting protein SNF7 [Xylariomycetidae sp. FL0641]